MTENLPVDISKRWEQRAAAAAAVIPATGGNFLSTQGGTLVFNDEQMPGNQVCVIILDAVLENTLYEGKYDPNNAAAPVCYAFSRLGEQDDMGPHPSMQDHPEYFQPQSDTCKGCQFNEYGSGDTGRGKACQNRARLALLPAGYYMPKRGSRDFDLELFDDPKHFQTADVAYLKLPVLSVKNYFKFVSEVSAAHRRDPAGVIARVYLEPDPKSQFKVHFETLELVPDALADIIMRRSDEAVSAKFGGYQPPQERETRAPVHQGGLRGLRRP